jgi:hypothetical protein
MLTFVAQWGDYFNHPSTICRSYGTGGAGGAVAKCDIIDITDKKWK